MDRVHIFVIIRHLATCIEGGSIAGTGCSPRLRLPNRRRAWVNQQRSAYATTHRRVAQLFQLRQRSHTLLRGSGALLRQVRYRQRQ